MKRVYLTLTLLLLTLVGAPSIAAFEAAHYTTESQLSQGRWLKIKITESGIHQLTPSQLKGWGFHNPERVRIYGYGGAELSDVFDAPFVDDLPQVPLWRENNRILFYAQGTVTWSYNGSTFVHQRNSYSTAGYYFITESDQPDLSLQKEEIVTPSDEAIPVTTFNDHGLHEQELVNVGRIGRTLYGEDFRYTAQQEFNFFTPGIVAGDAAIDVTFAAKTTTSTPIVVSVNGTKVSVASNYIGGSTQYYEQIRQHMMSRPWSATTNETQRVTIYFASGAHTAANLDYIRLHVERELKLYDGVVRFRNVQAISKQLTYQIAPQGATALRVWDITDAASPLALPNDQFQFTPTHTGMREYIAFQPDCTFPSPQSVGEVANQNLHATPQVDMVIIAPKQFKSAANRLAEFHRLQSDLTVAVVDPQLLYNEFSSGTPDVTAYRRFMKMLYDRGLEEDSSPRFLLLMGDAIYDSRLLVGELKNMNYPFVLTYSSLLGLDSRNSFVTDDYFGILEDGTGGSEMRRSRMQVGVGRFPVRTAEEANIAVNKVINYATNKEHGSWKNNLCFLADDGSDADNYTISYMSQADVLSKKVGEEFVKHKIYLDAFKQVSSASGATYPDARTKLYDLLESGTLMLNYIGHGSSVSLTGEGVVTLEDIKNNLYMKRLPLWVTATCDFSRFDDLAYSGGEEIFLNEKGGGIALFSTTRPVYTDRNERLNNAFIDHIFDKNKAGERYALGDIMRLAKNSYLDGYGNADPSNNHFNFLLLGDPAMKLAYPEYPMRITSINGEEVGGDTPIQLQARAMVTMKGEVLLPSGERDVNFNGVVYPRLFDSKIDVTTLDNNDTGIVFNYEEHANLLFSGLDSVRQGEFTFTFRMPTEINYSNEKGLLNLYAYDQAGNEAQGFENSFIVGDISTDTIPASEAPSIGGMYLNTHGFGEGATVNETPVFIASVSDSTGINVSGSGIGHDMTLMVDNDRNQQYTLTNYFTLDLGSYMRGEVRFKLPELSEGEHTLLFKVWNADNKSAQKEMRFKVKQGLEPTITHLYADQNPASASTNFYVTHDRPNALISVRIEVFNIMGQPVWSSNEVGVADEYSSFPITWNLTTTTGARVTPGVYLYRASLSTVNGVEATQSQKIVVVAQ